MLNWDALPKRLKTEEVAPYYNALCEKAISLAFKRVFDIALSLALIALALPLMAVIAVIVKWESPGPAIFRQVRITAGLRTFRILKFRTMVVNAEAAGLSLTLANDSRVTKIGRLLRRFRLDELPQLFNILQGDMSFVGARPEVPKYVEKYTSEMMATLLLPAGLTSMASIHFKDEERLIGSAEDADAYYVQQILPMKMEENLQYIKNYRFVSDIGIIVKTIAAVLR
jgi:lipopolysaccharide/colanic/teichoic acid biosynthesis glycosyltransferase